MPDAKPPVREPEEEELDELPPIDGGEAEDAELAPEELDEDEGLSTSGDGLDDSTGEDDPVDEELDIDGDEEGWLDGADDSEGLDVGTPEAFGSEEEEGQGSALLEGAEEPDAEEESDLGFGEEPTAVGDSGEEGFEDEEEALREEDLPRLDAGDDAEVDDPDLGDALPDDEEVEEPRPPWDDRAWDRAEGEARGLAMVEAVACAADGVVTGGEGLAKVDALGVVTPLEASGLRGGAPTAIAVDGAHVVVTTPRGGVLASVDGGKSFIEANGWRECVASEVGPAGRDADGGLEIVARGAEIWGRTRSGAVVWSPDRGATWARVEIARRFEAIALDAASGEAVAVARDGDVTWVARGARGVLALSARGALPAGRMVGAVAHGGRVAVGVAGRGVFRGDDAEWARFEGTASVTALAFGPYEAVLVAIHSESEGRAWIVAGKTAAPPSTLAEIEGSDEDEDGARVRALCWDAGRRVLWVAGGFGVLALRPALH